MTAVETDFRSRGAARTIVAAQAPISRAGPWLVAYGTLVALGVVAVVTAFAASIEAWTPAAWAALGLVAVGALWVSGGAATAVLGFGRAAPASLEVPPAWQPLQRTAVLVLLCGEPPEPLAAYLRTLRRRVDDLGMDGAVSIVVLSDTRDAGSIAMEESALAPLVARGAISYRRRSDNSGRKPGNIAEWVRREGDAFTYMAVLDADSRVSAERIRSLVYRIEHRPDLGLLQAGIAMVPGRSRFGRQQRLSNRLLSPNFGRGLAAWSGDVANYWGHNAIMRVAAFRSALALPVLPGPAPFGGPPLSHDFVEAALIRRAGWAVALDPDTRGSAEDGPQTLSDFHRRDRRWCQGNLQHLGIIAEAGLDPVSRLHLASGILGYLVAPAWLLLILLFAADVVHVGSLAPALAVTFILALPKVLAFAHWARRARTATRIRLVLRASLWELAVSTLIAPLVMVRQSGAVLAVLLGRDCGWKSGRKPTSTASQTLPEVAVGTLLLCLAAVTDATSMAWLLPVALPLVAAPLLQRWINEGA